MDPAVGIHLWVEKVRAFPVDNFTGRGIWILRRHDFHRRTKRLSVQMPSSTFPYPERTFFPFYVGPITSGTNGNQLMRVEDGAADRRVRVVVWMGFPAR